VRIAVSKWTPTADFEKHDPDDVARILAFFARPFGFDVEVDASGVPPPLFRSAVLVFRSAVLAASDGWRIRSAWRLFDVTTGKRLNA
jgi:hypothetical protein